MTFSHQDISKTTKKQKLPRASIAKVKEDQNLYYKTHLKLHFYSIEKRKRYNIIYTRKMLRSIMPKKNNKITAYIKTETAYCFRNKSGRLQ